MNGTVVIGEGEKDNAPMLYNGEKVGDGTGPECDVAVDPIDGTTLTAKGMTNAISVLAVAPRGTMYDPSAVFYMEKLVTGPEAAERGRHPLPRRREHPPGRQGQGLPPRGRHRRRARPPAARAARRGDPGHRRAHQVHHRRRRRRRDHGRPARHRHRPAARRRRHARGHHRRLRDEVPGRRDPGPAVAPGRRGAAEGHRRRPQARQGAHPHHRRPRHRRRLLLRGHRASPTAS